MKKLLKYFLASGAKLRSRCIRIDFMQCGCVALKLCKNTLFGHTALMPSRCDAQSPQNTHCAPWSEIFFVTQKTAILAIFRYDNKCVMSGSGARKFYSSWLMLTDQRACHQPY